MENQEKKNIKEIISTYRSCMDEQHYCTALDALCLAAHIIRETSPARECEVIEKLESVHYHNYLTAVEASEICNAIINEDGARGAHWTCDQVREVLHSIDVAEEHMPDYNFFAIYTLSNILYSEHATSVEDLIGADTPRVICNMAFRRFCNKNKERFLWH